MLTAKDLTRRWGISLPTIYKMFNNGVLPGLRISSRNIRFREEDVLAYEASTWNKSTPSVDTEVSSASTGGMTEDDPSVARLVRQMGIVLNDSLRNTSESNSFGGVPIIER